MEGEDSNQTYTVLTDVNHKTQFLNLIGVITSISPTLKRNKLGDVTLQISDWTQHNPGFTIKIMMASEVLDQFLSFAKEGLVIELLQIKIVKNDGEVYGEVRDEEEVRLFGDRFVHVQWYSEEEECKVSGKLKSTMKKLLVWKESNFNSKHILLGGSNQNERLLKKKTPEPKSKNYTSRPNLTHSSSVGNLLDKRGVDSLQKDMTILETNCLQGGSQTKMVSGKSIVSITPPSMKQINNVKRAKSTSKLTSIPLNIKETQKSVSANGNKKTCSMLDGNILPKSPIVLTESSMKVKSVLPVDSSALAKDMKMDSVYNKNNLRCGNTASPNKALNSSYKVSDKKQKKNTMLKAKSLSELKKKSSEIETYITRKMLRSTSTKFLTKSCVENPKDIFENLAKMKVSTTFPCSSGKSAKDDTKNGNREKMLKGSSLNKPAKKQPKSESKSDVNESDNRNNIWLENKLSRRKSLSNIQQDLKRKNVDIVKSTKLSSIIEKEVKSTKRSSKYIDSVEVETGNFNLKNQPSCAVSKQNTNTPVKRRVLNPEYFSDSSNSSQGLYDPVYLNSSDSSLTSSSKSHETESTNKKMSQKRKCIQGDSDELNQIPCKIKDLTQENTPLILRSSGNTYSKSSTKNEAKESLGLSKSKYEHSYKQTDSQGSNESLLAHDNSSSNSLSSTKQLADNPVLNRQKTSILSHKQTATEKLNKKSIVTNKRTSYKMVEKSNCASSEDDSKEQTCKKGAQSLTISKRGEQSDKKKETKRSIGNSPFENNDWFLKSLTRKVYYMQAHYIGDVSQCEISDVTLPEKFDLNCKVISQFTFYEEDIQVVRVLDGSIQRSRCLVIPECSTWKAVVERVCSNPVVEANLPFIDIIIFGFSRMDKPVVKDKCYEFQNIMAIKFLLKDSSKQRSKLDLFFCAKGQDMYTKKLKLNVQKEIEKKIEEKEYQAVWNSILDVEGKVSVEKILNKLEQSPLQVKARNNENTDSLVSLQSTGSKKNTSCGKRKLSEGSEYELITKKSQMDLDKAETVRTVEVETKLKHLHENDIETSIPGFKSNTKCESMNLNETPTELQAIVDIVQEEGDAALTERDDVHLKNSGSEITFSQFCKEADMKTKNFRTSTQNQNVFEDIVAQKTTESSDTVVENVNMDPLEYYTSSSSLSSIACISSAKKKGLSQKITASGTCSESVLKPLGDNSRTKAKRKHLKPNYNEGKSNLPNQKDSEEIQTCDSESVKVVSSMSSDSDVRVIKNINFSGTEKKSSVMNITHTNVVKEAEGAELIDIPENSESILCEFFSLKSVDKSPITNRHQKAQSMSEKMENGIEIERQNNSCLSTKNIPEKYFFKANDSFIQNESINTSLVLSIHEDDVNSVPCEDDGYTYCSYSIPKKKTFLDFSCIQKIMNKNYITIKVVLNGTKPPITASWASDIIKAECPMCHNLYSLNIASESSSCDAAALTVGSHVVCPDSQCYNQILESPKFCLSLDLKLKDGKVVTALIKNEVVEKLLGCTAHEVKSDQDKFKKAQKTLKKITRTMYAAEPIKVDVTRENICDSNSGPLYLLNMYL